MKLLNFFILCRKKGHDIYVLYGVVACSSQEVCFWQGDLGSLLHTLPYIWPFLC